MSMLIVPEPLFDQEMAVDAYWLRSHDGTKMLGLKDDYRAMDEAFIHRGLNLVERIGFEPFTGGKPLFVNVTKIQLITGVLNNFDLTHEHLIPVVSAQLAADAEAVAEHRPARRGAGRTGGRRVRPPAANTHQCIRKARFPGFFVMLRVGIRRSATAFG